MRVGIVERSVFPRDHVGESQLPPIGKILHEIGAWEKIEAAGFPVKLGASYTWGKTTEPWVFGFIPVDEIQSTTRPAKYEGWRTRVAMQVDRAKYDHILLEHARSLGTEIIQPHAIVDAKFDLPIQVSKSNRFCLMMAVNSERSTMSMPAAMRRCCDADLESPRMHLLCCETSPFGTIGVDLASTNHC